MILANANYTTTMPKMSLMSSQDAHQAMTVIDITHQQLQNEIGAIGALESRLSSAVRSLTVGSECFSAAASRITDIDVATETAALVRAQILQQLGTAILAQANQMPSVVLKMLGSG